MEFVETFKCNLSRSTIPIIRPICKVGGEPILFESMNWPRCRHCNQEMDFVCQLPLDKPVGVSTQYMMAYLFLCPGEFDENGWLTCPRWAASEGANTVILQKRNRRYRAMQGGAKLPEYRVDLEHHLEPRVDTANIRLDEVILDQPYCGTKIGGTPCWLQQDETPLCPVCGGSTRFLAQVDPELDGPLGVNPSIDKDKVILNCGRGYIFICERQCGPNGAAFLYQVD